MSMLFSCSLYYLSFFPLWLAVLFVDLKSYIENEYGRLTEIVSMICILTFGIISLIILIIVMRTNGKEGSMRQELKSVREEKAITAEYLLSYVLPLFAFDFSVWNEVVLFLIFFLTFGFLCIRHHYFSVNIILEIANYRFYKCELLNEDDIVTECIVISRRNLMGYISENIYVRALNNEYFLDMNIN